MFKIDVMRFLDNYVGLILCAALDACESVRLLLHIGRRRSAGGAEESILVIKLWGIGSVILSKPAMMSLKSRLPHARIVYVTFSENKPILEALGTADEILCIRRSGMGVFLSDTVKTVKRLRKIQPSVAIDLEFLSKYSGLLMYLSGARRRIGFYLPKMYRGKYLLTDRVFYSMYSHVAESFLELVRVLGTEKVELDDLIGEPLLEVRQEWLRAVEEKLTRAFKRYDHLVAINPNAGEIGIERRRWPAGNFVELVRGLSQKYENIGFIVTGSESEAGYVEEISRAVNRRNVISLAGQLSLTELAALFKESCLVISNDSGPLHIAAAVGTKTLAFFGPETPAIYGPVGGGHTVFYKGIYCSPCHNMFNAKRYHCPFDNRCLREIGVQEVFAAADHEIALAVESRVQDGRT